MHGPTRISTEARKARKQYRCFLCSHPIEVGESYARTSYMGDGGFYVLKEHRVCEEIGAKFHFRAGLDWIDMDYGYQSLREDFDARDLAALGPAANVVLGLLETRIGRDALFACATSK